LPGPMINNETTIFALKTGSRLEATEALELVADGKVKASYQMRKMEELTQVRRPKGSRLTAVTNMRPGVRRNACREDAWSLCD
jgi:hypothetical protein